MQAKLQMLQEEISKIIIGKENIIRQGLLAILAKGHILLEDIPGVGKTTLALAFSKVMSFDYKRIQFTPDVLPSDVMGFSMYNKQTNEFEYKEGAVMCNLLLADEINRTSPKTQSALLEAMEEGKVTVDGVTRDIPVPFAVIATQNPHGSVGTQKLPESQLDRFTVKLSLGYPDMQSEMQILMGQVGRAVENIQPVITREELMYMQQAVENTYIHPDVCDYLVRLINATRNHEYIELGLSPRGGIALLNMAKANAFLNNRNYTVPEDIVDVLPFVGIHRIVLSPKAKASGINEEKVLEIVRQTVAVTKA